MLQMKYCGDGVLREVSEPVVEITPEMRKIMDEMVEMMESEKGVGLAAPQVGISSRFVVIKEIKGRGDKGTIIKMINPRIVSYSDDLVEMEEGCLSVLGPDGPVYANVVRPDAVVAEWMDENGTPQTKKFSGFSARIVQHELDHLDGVLFIDHLSSVKREMVMRKVKKGDKHKSLVTV